MTVGTAVFASVFSSVVLVLAVYNKQFRKVLFWFAGISALGAGTFFLGMRLYRKHEAKQRADAERRITACIARFPAPYLFNGERMSAFAIASACMKDPDFTPDPNSPSLAKVVEVHSGGVLQITPRQQFSPEGDADFIPVIYLGHHQTFVLMCGNYGEQGTSVSINQGLVSCPEAPADHEHECAQRDGKPAKWGLYIGLSLGDCTKNGCVVYHDKKIVGGISRNEITSARWDTCATGAGPI